VHLIHDSGSIFTLKIHKLLYLLDYYDSAREVVPVNRGFPNETVDYLNSSFVISPTLVGHFFA
jgi:hypothetical protein